MASSAAGLLSCVSIRCETSSAFRSASSAGRGERGGGGGIKRRRGPAYRERGAGGSSSRPHAQGARSAGSAARVLTRHERRRAVKDPGGRVDQQALPRLRGGRCCAGGVLAQHAELALAQAQALLPVGHAHLQPRGWIAWGVGGSRELAGRRGGKRRPCAHRRQQHSSAVQPCPPASAARLVSARCSRAG